MNNISNPKAFKQKFSQVMHGLQDLFSLAAEHEIPQDDPCSFDLPNGYERGDEFLQTVLDMIRCNFDPASMGTLLLNGNMGHILDAVPDTPFCAAYASVGMDDVSELPRVWEKECVPRLGNVDNSTGIRPQYFIVVSTGKERYGLELVNGVAGFFVDHFPDDITLGGNIGFCLDPMLGSRLRLSVWCFHQSPA